MTRANVLRLLAVGLAVATVALLYRGLVPTTAEPTVSLGPRPFYLVDGMADSPLKRALQSCRNGPFRPTAFSIGHRGAALQFPEHTKESYEAAAAMGAGVVECDVTFTADKELVCRHSQCDLHRTTDILVTELAGKCSAPFIPATRNVQGDTVTPASANCCTSDITLAEFKTLKGKMDGFNPAAMTPREFLQGTPGWRTDLYAGNSTVLSHRESIALLRELGVKMSPELKSPTVPMPFAGMSRSDYAGKLIDEYRTAGVPAEAVRPQSFDLADVRYWLQSEPEFGERVIFLDGRYREPGFDHRDPATWSPSMSELAAIGVRTIAPPLWMLLEVEDGDIVPSVYAVAARHAGLAIVTWTLERDGSLADGGGWDLQTLNGTNRPPGEPAAPGLIDKDGDLYNVVDALATRVGVSAIFSDWPATVTYYANCMSLE